MIAKIVMGSNVNGLIHYLTNKKHKVLTTNNLFPDANVKYISSEFRQIQDLNQRCKKNIIHVTLAFPKDEDVDTEKIKIITEDFLNKFGANENQWLSIQHFDTEHKHCHTIINRVKIDGKLLSDSFSYIKAKRICRELELKYNLKSLSSLKSENKNISISDLKYIIDQAILECKTFDEFKRLIDKKGYKVLKGRGISFVNKNNGHKIKGSDIGRSYSLMNINEQLSGPHNSNDFKRSLDKEQVEINELIMSETEEVYTYESIADILIGDMNNSQLNHKKKKKKVIKKRKL